MAGMSLKEKGTVCVQYMISPTILASNVNKPMNSPLCDCYTHTSKWLSKNDQYNHTLP